MDFERFIQGEQFQYINNMRPVLSQGGLFSDTTGNYVIPAEPAPYSEVAIRFRSKKNNLDRVFFLCASERVMMNRVESDELFDYYEYRKFLDNEPLSYCFEVQSGHAMYYYDRLGVHRSKPGRDGLFTIIPGFSTPDWAKGAVMYQIMVDRFRNGDPTNDVLTDEYAYIKGHSTQVQDWYRYPAQMDVRNFYGGDLKGVMDKLDYLQKLGVEVIYFNPLFVSPSNHKYDIQDYDHIDPHFGRIVEDEGELLAEGDLDNKHATRYINRVTNLANLEASNELFAELVEEIHKRGMKVIIDGVFNHCGSFNKWMDRERIYEGQEGYANGAYISADSPTGNYFDFRNREAWPYNGSYEGWWGHETLPKLNYEASRELYDEILRIGVKWVSPPYNVDGWRLDVAADLGHGEEFNHRFWKDFRRAVKQANPNAIILAEHYGDPSSWLDGKQWDSVMNYDAFMEPITWFLTGMQKHSDDYRADQLGNASQFWKTMNEMGGRLPFSAMSVAMNELSNHDHSRFLTRTNHVIGRTNTHGPEAANKDVDKNVMRQAVLMQMTWPGAPTVYYGDEAGLCGFTDPDNRRTYPWGLEDNDLLEFHREMIRIHRENSEFRNGSLKNMFVKKMEAGVLGYGRFNADGHSLILVNVNNVDEVRKIKVWTLGVPREGVMTRLMYTDAAGYSTEAVSYPVAGGALEITIPAGSAMVLQYKNTMAKNNITTSNENSKKPEVETLWKRKNFLQFK